MKTIVERARASLMHIECFYAESEDDQKRVRSIAAAIAALSEDNARLRRALEPFAKAGELFDGAPIDPRYVVVIYMPAAGEDYTITDRHLRAARDAYQHEGGGREG